MERERPSDTAALAAMLRAAHPLMDNKPWILKDDFAVSFSGVESPAALRAALTTFEEEFSRRFPRALVQAWIRYARAVVIGRARYTEDELRKAIARGVSQYVILGAGFDSFAYRKGDVDVRLQVFEVDYPATQQRKQARLRELRMEVPPHLTFIPVDFEKESIIDALCATGFRRDEPAFFFLAWGSAVPSDDAFVHTLKQVASVSNGSEIVFDYLVPKALVDDEGRQVIELAESVATAEPVRSCFEPARLAARMKDMGFAQIWDVDAEEANSRYFAGRADGLRIPQVLHLLKAELSRSRA